MKFLPILLLLIPVIIASEIQKSEKSHEVTQDDTQLKKRALRETVKGNNEFTVNFFKRLTSVSSQTKDSPPKNVVLSPLSISSAFSMLVLGAHSQTHQELWEGLSLNNTHCKENEVHQAYSSLLQTLNSPQSSLQVKVGNAVFLDNKMTLLKKFKDDVEHYYHAKIETEDFSQPKEVENTINEYVKNKTEGKIEELVQGVSEDAKMILINYVLFKGEWENTFQPDSTRAGKFFVDKDTSVEVPMMHRTGVYNTYYDTKLPCTVVELPYKDNASMIIAIAEQGKIHEVEQGLSFETLHRWKTSSRNGFVEIYMPKFTVSSKINLKETLPELGIRTAFTDMADFSGITDDVMLKVGSAVHESVVSVDERGTEAAAASAIEMVPMALFPVIKVDRPFVMVICEHNTRSILFIGTVANPAQS